MSMRKYSQVRPKDWINDHYPSIYRKAGPSAYYVWLYLVSGPHAHSTGLLRVQAVTIADDLDMTPEEVNSELGKLEQSGFLDWDCDNSILLLHGEFERQTPIKTGGGYYRPDKRIAGAQTHAETFSFSSLAAVFLQYLAGLLDTDTDTEREHAEKAPPKPLVSPLDTPSKPLPVAEVSNADR